MGAEEKPKTGRMADRGHSRQEKEALKKEERSLSAWWP